MLNWKFFNAHDIVLILIVMIAVHMLAKPLYAAIDNAARADDQA